MNYFSGKKNKFRREIAMKYITGKNMFRSETAMKYISVKK